MAEDYGLTLKIGTDTTDLDKLPQKVEETRKKIEQPVAPVKIEAKAAKVRVEVDDEEAKKRIEALTEKEGVKRIRVVTEGGELASRTAGKEIFELEVDAEKAKQTIADLKADARLKVTADTSAAERSMSAFFASFRRGVAGLRAAISSVFAAFGMVTFVVGGIMALVAVFQKLRDMATATSRAIAQMRWDSWVGGFNAAADAMIGKHQKLIALLKEEQDVANKAASLRTMETTQNRAQEDSARQQVRAAVLAGATDPRERQRLEDNFAAEDDRIARERHEQDKRARLRQLDDEESLYRSKENAARSKLPEIDEQIANQEEVVLRSRMSTSQGGNKKNNDKYIEEAQKRIAALKSEKKALEDLAQTMKREADYRKEQAKIVEQSKAPVSGQSAREAGWKAQESNDRKAQLDFEREQQRLAERAADDDRLRSAQFAERAALTQKEKDAARAEQVAILKDRETKATASATVASNTLNYELSKPVAERDDEVIAKARENIAAGKEAALQARQAREDIERSAAIEQRDRQVDYFTRLAGEIESARPKNRLAAMGLGSGVSVDPIARQNAANVEAILDQCQHILQALRDNKPTAAAAVYS